jgi:competence protein ComEC
MFPRPPSDNFAAARWLARDGDARGAKAAIGGARCDSESCVTTARDGSLIAMPRRAEALAEDCAHAAIIISAVPAPGCVGPKLVLDSKAIGEGGGYAITDGKALSVRQSRGDRPWVQ